MDYSKILILLAAIVFALATFGVSFTHVQLVPLGLLFYVSARLVK